MQRQFVATIHILGKTVYVEGNFAVPEINDDKQLV